MGVCSEPLGAFKVAQQIFLGLFSFCASHCVFSCTQKCQFINKKAIYIRYVIASHVPELNANDL